MMIFGILTSAAIMATKRSKLDSPVFQLSERDAYIRKLVSENAELKESLKEKDEAIEYLSTNRFEPLTSSPV